MPEPTQRNWRELVPHRLWVLPGLCVVLCAIGFVQFRWIDEVARAQRERAFAALHASLARFTSDFDTEIARIHFTFQIPVPGESTDTEAALQYRLGKWRELAPYPRLISEVKVMKPERGQPELVFTTNGGANGPTLRGGVAFPAGIGAGAVTS
jgi:hypothetical protein